MNDVSRRGMLAASGVVALGVPGAAAGAPAGRRARVEHYTTGPRAELVQTIARVRAAPYRFTTLYSLKLPGLRTGDAVQAHSQFEVTNDLGFNVMIAHAMLVHREETILVEDERRPEGRVISEYAGENVTPDMHHGFRTLAGSFAAEADGDAWVSVILYAASDAPGPGDLVAVMPGYGGLRAIVFRSGPE